MVAAGSWGQASNDAAAAATAWQAYQAGNNSVPKPLQDAPAAALARLQQTTAAKQTGATFQAANDLSAAVADLFMAYQPVLPADLGWLDVLDWQVRLDVAANDLTAAADSLARAGVVWAWVKPAVLAHKGADAAAQFEASRGPAAGAGG